MTDDTSLALTPKIRLDDLAYPCPHSGETITCAILVVGDSLAAYTATIAALQTGAQVCLVQPQAIGRGQWITPPPEQVPAKTLENPWLGRQQVPAEQFSLSRSQRHFRDLTLALPTAATTAIAPVATPNLTLNSTPENNQRNSLAAIAPFLQTRQLILIPFAKPVMVLHRDQRGHLRRIFQVVFRRTREQRWFKVHSQLTIDATRTGLLARLSQLQPMPLADLEPTTSGADHQNSKPLSRFPLRQARSECFQDSIGIGYMGKGTAAVTSSRFQSADATQSLKPFTIALRSLLPQATEGMILASPSLSPQPSNLPPASVEWAVGEAAGHLAAFAIANQQSLQTIATNPHLIRALQQRLTQQGIPLFWFDDLSHQDPDFEAIQMLAVANILRTTSVRDLHFRPTGLVSRAVLATTLVKTLMPADSPRPIQSSTPSFVDVPTTHWAYDYIETVVHLGWMTTLAPHRFIPSRPVTRHDFHTLLQPITPIPLDNLFAHIPNNDQPLKRRELARVLYPLFWHQVNPSIGTQTA